MLRHAYLKRQRPHAGLPCPRRVFHAGLARALGLPCGAASPRRDTLKIAHPLRTLRASRARPMAGAWQAHVCAMFKRNAAVNAGDLTIHSHIHIQNPFLLGKFPQCWNRGKFPPTLCIAFRSLL